MDASWTSWHVTAGSEAYRLWFEIRTDILSNLSGFSSGAAASLKQKEFKPIKNMVIAEAAKLFEQSFTDEIIVPIETGDSAKQEAPDAESKSSPLEKGSKRQQLLTAGTSG